MKQTPGMTKVHDDRMQKLINNTPPGMAHWAGTGPLGRKCKECAEFSEQRCMKFQRMMKKKGAKFSGRTPSCRYFEQQ